MMRLFFLLTLLIAMFIDSYLTLYTLYYLRITEAWFWIYHIIVAFIFLLLNRIFFKKDLTYYDTIIILFPTVGYFGIFFIEILPKRDSHYTEIEENIDLEYYIKDIQEIEYIDVELQLDLIGAYDNLFTDSFKEKKLFLMGFNPPEVSFKVDVLRKALLDDEIDVIHYAAVELNKIEEEFQSKITLSEKSENYEDSLNEYLNYIKSGLPKGELLYFYQKKALTLIQNLKNSKWDLQEIQILNSLKEHKLCEKKIQILLKKKFRPDIINFILKYYYEKNEFSRVIDIKKRYSQDTSSLPFHLKNNLHRK